MMLGLAKYLEVIRGTLGVSGLDWSLEGLG